MYALVYDRTKQYVMTPGGNVTVDFLAEAPGTEITFETVLVVRTDDDLHVGTPYLVGARVTAELLDTVKGDKVWIGKFKRRKNFRRRTAHRQPYSLLKVKEITL
jgi:large subunit ribosomal protein L21